ncbi:MAG: hypothetical protein UX28_C0006G0006 [Candidatus Pacebacteria bacterium GW2011_GWA1_46_10]|nr:MAG: hypothetical protein UX28_C0006G0006 [Candidatus Pacebacteria bacterium GW2011_GWA1_46_10]
MESPFASLIISVVLKAAIIIIALQIALNKTKSLSGAAGTWATKAGTVAFGAAIGTAAFAGRQTIGRAANSEFMKKQVAKLGDGAVGRTADRALGAVGSGTMDLRGLPGGKYMGLGGVKYGKGGIKKSIDAAERRKTEFATRRMNAIDPETGKPRGDTQVSAMEYATDEERVAHWKKQQEYDVAMVKTHPAQMKAYETATQKYQEDMMFYEKETAEKAPENPGKFTISARERLARQHAGSWSASSRAAAENIRKGKTGKDYEEDDERKEFKEWKKDKKEGVSQTVEKEAKSSENEGESKPKNT